MVSTSPGRQCSPSQQEKPEPANNGREKTFKGACSSRNRNGTTTPESDETNALRPETEKTPAEPTDRAGKHKTDPPRIPCRYCLNTTQHGPRCQSFRRNPQGLALTVGASGRLVSQAGEKGGYQNCFILTRRLQVVLNSQPQRNKTE